MSATFWTATAGGLFLLLALHPFTTYPLTLWLLARRQVRTTFSPGQGSALSCAVCMCAYNEEHGIDAKMNNLMRLRELEPDLEILVYVDAASDRTADILRRYGDHIDLHVAVERHGKTHGMNLLAARARADLLLFTDANVLLDESCVENFRRHFADPAVGCVSGNLVYTNPAGSATAESGSLYWRFEEWLKRLEQKTGSVMGADGSLFAVRRSLHRSPPDYIIDDMYVSLMVLCQGYRIIQATDARGYEESVTSSGEEFRRKIRIACQAFNVHRLLWPELRQLGMFDVYKYVSHKLIRWLAIYFLGASALAFAAALLMAGQAIWVAIAGVVTGLGLATGQVWGLKPFSQVVEILKAFLGTGIGVWRSVRGERFQTWSPATSIRRKSVAG